ncbi:MAG: hydroxyacylglutathione hydrolase [Polynucleobacter sp.]|nr:hydroxyacylglutathione hydrolase [Polynucleobacter sp.]
MVTKTALQVWPIPAFDDNYIWCIHDGQSALVVDPGDAGPVIAFLQKEALTLTGILITHHHADHTGGIVSLLSYAESSIDKVVPVYGPATESIPGRTHALMEGDAVEFTAPAIEFSVFEVPGHTLGHIAYFADGLAPKLFCGDTLFASGCGRLFEGTPTQMTLSLAKFAALPPETAVYCTHEYTLSNIRFALAVEPNNADLIAWSKHAHALREANTPTLPTTIAHERRVNPFMRSDQPDVIEAALRESGAPALPSDAHVLAAIRAWKDRF